MQKYDLATKSIQSIYTFGWKEKEKVYKNNSQIPLEVVEKLLSPHFFGTCLPAASSGMVFTTTHVVGELGCARSARVDKAGS